MVTAMAVMVATVVATVVVTVVMEDIQDQDQLELLRYFKHFAYGNEKFRTQNVSNKYEYS